MVKLDITALYESEIPDATSGMPTIYLELELP